MKKRKKVDFSSLDFDINNILQQGEAPDLEKEFISAARLNFAPVAFENACEAADYIDLTRDYFCLVSGKFVFGDFIEAILYKKKIKPNAIYITTLGMGRENIDSIVNLCVLGAQVVNLIVSNYFVAMDRRGLVPYMVQEFTGRPINVAVLASHCKLCLIDAGENKIIIAGSANLSSSNNVEQFQIFHDEAVFNAVKAMLDGVLEKHTVLHGITGETIFQNNRNNTGKDAFKRVKEVL